MRSYLIDVGQNGDLDLIAELAQPDMVDEANQVFGGSPGRDGLVEHVVGFRRNVTDSTVTIREIVAGEHHVMAWWEFDGVHTGPWLGEVATGDALHGTVFSFFRLRDHLIDHYRLWLHAGFAEPVVFDSSTGELRRA